MSNYHQVIFLTLAALLVFVRGEPIMVSFGTRMAPITAPTPRPRIAVTYPLIPPAPVHEDPESENNFIYKVPPLRFGFRIKPLVKQLPYYGKYYY